MKSTTDKIAYKHPAIFPEKLARDHIISWSNPGDVVLDKIFRFLIQSQDNMRDVKIRCM